MRSCALVVTPHHSSSLTRSIFKDLIIKTVNYTSLRFYRLNVLTSPSATSRASLLQEVISLVSEKGSLASVFNDQKTPKPNTCVVRIINRQASQLKRSTPKLEEWKSQTRVWQLSRSAWTSSMVRQNASKIGNGRHSCTSSATRYSEE